MLAISANARIFFFQNPVDMRKGIETLCSLVEESRLDGLLSGAYFVFINRMKDKMKVLYWDNDGLPFGGNALKRVVFVFQGSIDVLSIVKNSSCS